MKRIIIALIALLPLTSVAQEHCVAFSPAVFKQADKLSEKSMATLKLKIEQIITRSNAAKTALYSAFIICPEINITSKRTVNAGMNDITVVEAELTLIAANSIDNSMYGSTSITLEGSGKSEDAAFSSMFQAIKATNPAFVKFIKNATSEIINYYSSNMPTVLRKAETLMAGEKYDDAMLFLESIPICVPSYEQSSDAIQAIYKVIADKSCFTTLTMAERAYAFGDFHQAKELIMTIKPGSKCDDKVNKLIAQLADSLKGKAAPEVITQIKEVEVIKEVPVIKEVVKEVPVEVIKEVVKEVPVEVIKEVVKEVPATAETTSSRFPSIKDPAPGLKAKIISCSGTPSTNKVSITILLTNTSELEMRIYSNNSKAYNTSGDEFRSDRNGSYSIDIPSGLSIKTEYVVSSVPTSNKQLILVAEIICNSQSGKIDARNIPIKW